jgi:hypothetical protein
MSWGIDKIGKDRAKLKAVVGALIDRIGAEVAGSGEPGLNHTGKVKEAIFAAIDTMKHHRGLVRVQTEGHLFVMGGALRIEVTCLEPLADDDYTAGSDVGT